MQDTNDNVTAVERRIVAQLRKELGHAHRHKGNETAYSYEAGFTAGMKRALAVIVNEAEPLPVALPVKPEKPLLAFDVTVEFWNANFTKRDADYFTWVVRVYAKTLGMACSDGHRRVLRAFPKRLRKASTAVAVLVKDSP